MELSRYPLVAEIYRSSNFVRGWMDQLKERRRGDFEHSLRVAYILSGLGKYVGYDGDMIVALVQAGIMHDIGKMMVPDGVLESDKLTNEQRELRDSHVRTSFESIKIQNPLAAKIIVAHHEFQERKYPRQNNREPVDLNLGKMQQLLALADQTDSLLSERSYKQAWSVAETKEYLLKQFEDVKLVSKAIDLRVGI